MELKRILPFLSWLSKYKFKYFKADGLAGMTVAILLIPQSMAYALLAGLPPIYGLYAGLVPLFIYALFGSSNHLSIGPVAVSSLLVFSGVSQIAEVGTPEYIAIVLTLGCLVGMLQMFLSIFKMGFLVNFLSHPVIIGFTSAAAIIIAINQLKYILGLDIPRFEHSYEILIYEAQKIKNTNPFSLSLGLGSIALMLLLKRINKKLPGALIAVFLGICICYWFNLQQYGIAIVGSIPQGLPAFYFPQFSLEMLNQLYPVVLTVTLIGIVESISIAKVLESKQQTYRIKPNQELFALGISKTLGSFFQAMPSSGSFARSTVNFESRSITQMSSIVTAFIIALSLLFLTPLFYYIPLAVLAAIILLAIKNLFAFKEAIYLWKAQKSDFFMMLVTFLVTLFIGIEQGVLTGVVLSILTVLFRSSIPHIAVLGNIPNTTVYRNKDRFTIIDKSPEILIIRFDEQLYFANAAYFKDFVFDIINDRKEKTEVLILDASSIHRIDSTGLQVLKEVDAFLNNRAIKFYLSGFIGPVRDRLYKFGVMRAGGQKDYFLRIHDAVEHFKQSQKNDSAVWDSSAVQTNVAENDE